MPPVTPLDIQHTQDDVIFTYIKENKAVSEISDYIKQSPSRILLTNAEKSTPLDYALQFSNFKAAALFLTNDANLSAYNKEGLTPLHTLVKCVPLYVEKGMSAKEIVELAAEFIARGAKPELQDRRGNTIINFIAQKAKPMGIVGEIYTQLGQLVIAQDKEAFKTVRVKNNMGKTPLDYLSRNRNTILRDLTYEEFMNNQYKTDRIIEQGKLSVKQVAMLEKEIA